jgi:golgi SNAP receptor complex member 2
MVGSQTACTWYQKLTSPPQNSVFNSALKQSSSIRKDLDAFAASPTTTPPSLQGQISASLTSFSRTIDQYADLTKHELNPSKVDKATERIKSFRADLTFYRTQLDALKAARDDSLTTINRTELLGRRPHHASTPENPYSNANISSAAATTSPWAPSHASSGSIGLGSGDVTREAHALREQNFFANTHSALDEYLARGQAVLGDLGQQREMLKGTQKRLYSVANTLGVSGDTIRMVERRAKQDKWIFGVGVVVFFVFCWLVLRYLRWWEVLWQEWFCSRNAESCKMYHELRGFGSEEFWSLITGKQWRQGKAIKMASLTEVEFWKIIILLVSKFSHLLVSREELCSYLKYFVIQPSWSCHC